MRVSRRNPVLGINRRNIDYVLELNPRARFPLADDKILCKEKLSEAGFPVPETRGIVRGRREIEAMLDALSEGPPFVVKPARGFGGQGVLLLEGADSGWRSAGGRAVSRDALRFHIAGILSGMYSLDHLQDRVLIEEKLEDITLLSAVHGDRGVSDLRVIVAESEPVMAMLRLPSRASGGSANLHAGGLGVGVDIDRGRTTFAISGVRPIDAHPDTGRALSGIEIPEWERILEVCRPINEVFAMGYLGVDIVLDRQRGPVVLEVNARPGLAIQLANRAGLRPKLEDGRRASRDGG